VDGNRRPLSVTILASVYLFTGVVGFAYHFHELLAANPFQNDAVWVELTEFIALVCGAFMLQGRNWARWLAIAWMGFHVFVSIYVARQLAVHSLFFIVIAWTLFRPGALRYFRGARGEAG
jgi:hypothetical protein